MYAPSDFEQSLLMKALAETFTKLYFLSLYIYICMYVCMCIYISISIYMNKYIDMINLC